MGRQKHNVEVVSTDLQIEEQLRLHEIGWVIQRIGWITMIALMIAAAIGVFGNGPISKKRSSAGPFSIEYESLFRHEAEMKILIESAGDHISTVALPQEYLKNFRIVRFVPEPERNSSIENNVQYTFANGNNMILSIYVIPKEYGSIKGNINVNETNSIHVSHFIYP